jgi:hypothetical protein
LILALLGISTFVGLRSLIVYEGARWLEPLFVVNLIILAFAALTLPLSLLKTPIYRFQAFSSGVMAAMSALFVYAICLLALVVMSFDGARGEGLSPSVFGIAGMLSLPLVAGATAVHVVLLRRRLVLGHSEKRTVGNYVAVSRSSRSQTFWVSFGLVALAGPNVLTGGQYLITSIGVIMLVVFALFTTSLPVEFAYLAYLKSKDRAYWERPPRALPRRERLRVARKVVLWVLAIAAGVGLFWVLAKYVL